MQGIAKLKNLDTAYKKELKNVFFWNGKDFEVFTPGKTKSSHRNGEFGPELGFAYKMAQLKPGKKIYLIKFAASGQPLHHGWNGKKWVGGKASAGRRNF